MDRITYLLPSTLNMPLSLLLVALSASVTVNACGGDHPPAHFQKRHVYGDHGDIYARQASTTYPTGPAYDVPPLASITPTPVTDTQNVLPVIATYAPGSQPPLSGAPPLPTCTSPSTIQRTLSLLTICRYYPAELLA
jgi:hypothetical protein